MADLFSLTLYLFGFVISVVFSELFAVDFYTLNVLLYY